jgi:hypothetical protein
MVENYQNDFYFQTYVNSSIQGSGFTIVALSSVGIFSAVAMGLYMKLRRTHRELEHLILTEHAPPEEQGPLTVLQPHVEQHLIDPGVEAGRARQLDTISVSDVCPEFFLICRFIYCGLF